MVTVWINDFDSYRFSSSLFSIQLQGCVIESEMFRLFFKFPTVFSTFVCLLFQVPDGVAAQSYSHLLNIVNNSWAQKQIQNIFKRENYRRQIPKENSRNWKYFFSCKKIIRVFLFVTFCNMVSEEFPASPTPLPANS